MTIEKILQQAEEAVKIGRAVLAADEPVDEAADDKAESSAGRLIDLLVFLKALDLAASTLDSVPMGPEISSPEARDARIAVNQAIDQGLRLAIRREDDLIQDVNQYLVPLMDGWGLKSFKVKWDRVGKPARGNLKRWRMRAAVLMNMMERLKSKPTLLRSAFVDSRVQLAAKRFVEVFDAATVPEAFTILAKVRPVGGMTLTRRWVRQAAKDVGGVEVSEVEELVADAAAAADLGEQLRQADIEITNAAPEASATAAQKREEVVKAIEELVDTSVNPTAIATAVAVAASDPSKPSHMTTVGKSLNMSPAQERSMMLRGKGIVAAGAGSGKCVRGDTLVTTTKGVFRIDELHGDGRLVSVAADTLGVSVENGTWLDMGTSPTIKIETESGIEIVATPEHPLLTWNGEQAVWKRVDALSADDVVLLLPGHALEGGTACVSLDEAYLLGLWMGNGWLSASPAKVSWSSANEQLIPVYRKLASTVWGVTVATYQSGERCPNHEVSSIDLVTRLSLQGLLKAGHNSTSAREKQVPAWLMAATAAEKLAFLRGLFDTDGSADSRGFEWLSASETLARQVHQMLLGLGVVGRLKPKTVDGYDHTYWRVLVGGDQLRIFRDGVGFGNDKTKQARLDAACDKPCNPNVGCFDVSGALPKVRDEWKEAKQWDGHRQALLSDGLSVKDYLLGKRGISRERLKRLVTGWSTPAALLLRNLAGFYPDPVKAVTKGTEERVYDFTVPTTHSFIANGIVSHNTRVLSGKVVYHVKELGAPPESVLATSFTRKSAAELKDRITKAGVDVDKGVAADGFGTTHSIAAKLINRFFPGLPRRKNIGGKDGHSQTALFKIAIAQVKMRPSGAVTSQPDPNESFFSQPALEKTAKDLGVRQAAAPAPAPGASGAEDAVPFSEAVTRAVAWLNSPDAARLNNLGWIREYKLKNPNYDVVKATQTLFREISSGALRRDRMTDGQRRRFMEVMRMADINFVPGVSASVVSAVGEKKQKDFSRFRDVPANQWFNLGVMLDRMKEEQPDRYEKLLGELTPGNVGRQITQWKGGLITPGQAYSMHNNPEHGDYGMQKALEAAAYAAYEWVKANDEVYIGSGDPDDLLINFSRLAILNEGFRSSLQRRFKYVLVDEAQDQNPAQHLMFGLITGSYDPATQKPRTDGQMTADTYTLIGDDKQSIYEFRGAAPSIFIDNSDTMGGQFKTEFLDTNYRSGTKIVEAAGNIISHNEHQIPMECKPFPPRGDGAVRIVPSGNDAAGFQAAAAQVASEVKAGVAEGDSYENYGVGCRTNKEAYVFAAKLLENGIPFRSKWNPLTAKATQGLLNWVVLSTADEANLALINGLVIKCLASPYFNINQKTLEERLQQLAAKDQFSGMTYLQILEGGGWRQIYSGSRNEEFVKPYVDMLRLAKGFTGAPSEVVARILNEVRGVDGKSMLEDLVERQKESEEDDASDAEEQSDVPDEESEEVKQQRVKEAALAPLQPILSLAAMYTDVPSFLTYLRELARANDRLFIDDNDPKNQEKVFNAVNIDTVHGWKGLEVHHMYVPVAAGAFPHFKAESMESERRLAYVAVTRGEDSVTIFDIKRTDPKTKTSYSSKFIGELACKAGKSVGASLTDYDNEAEYPHWADPIVSAAVSPPPEPSFDIWDAWDAAKSASVPSGIEVTAASFVPRRGK